MENLTELMGHELIEIEAGWNLIEYIAMGIGYVHGTIHHISSHTSNSSVHNNWLYK